MPAAGRRWPICLGHKHLGEDSRVSGQPAVVTGLTTPVYSPWRHPLAAIKGRWTAGKPTGRSSSAAWNFAVTWSPNRRGSAAASVVRSWACALGACRHMASQIPRQPWASCCFQRTAAARSVHSAHQRSAMSGSPALSSAGHFFGSGGNSAASSQWLASCQSRSAGVSGGIFPASLPTLFPWLRGG